MLINVNETVKPKSHKKKKYKSVTICTHSWGTFLCTRWDSACFGNCWLRPVRAAIGPSNPLLSIYLKTKKHACQIYMTPYVHCSIVQAGQDLETITVSFSGGPGPDREMWAIHTLECDSARRKRGDTAVGHDMDGPWEHDASGISQAGEARNHMIPCVCGIENRNSWAQTVVGGCQTGKGKGEGGPKEDRKGFDFGWWAQTLSHRTPYPKLRSSYEPMSPQ